MARNYSAPKVDLDSYRTRNEHLRTEYMKKVGEAAARQYGFKPIMATVSIRDPFIESRILIVPSMSGTVPGYTIVQLGNAHNYNLDVVSLPESNHTGILNRYVQDFLGQMPNLDSSSGGHIKFSGSGGVRLYGVSEDLGNSLSGYDSNSIAASILRSAKIFHSVEAEPDRLLNPNVGEFFDSLLETFRKVVLKK